MKAGPIGPARALAVLLRGGYLERRDERTTNKQCPKFMTRLYDSWGVDQGVANFARRRLQSMCRLREIKGPEGQQRWVLK